jgi:hypothetical protein
MPIQKVLVLSTAHIQASTDIFLSEVNPMIELKIPRFVKTIKHHYGYIMFLSPEMNFEELEQYLAKNDIGELLPIIKYAVKNNCFMLNFDRDAEEMKTFKTFKW